MTDEELNKKADEFINTDDDALDKMLEENLEGLKLNEKQAGTIIGLIKGSFIAGYKTCEAEHKDDMEILGTTYIRGVHRGKEIAEEKLKCCTNCKYYSMEFLPYFCIKNQIPTHCTEHCDKWELRR